MGIIGSLFGPKKGPRDFNCARVHRGEYLTGTNQFTRQVRHDFQVIHGEADVTPGRSVRVQYGLEEETCSPTVLETFYIFPKSPCARVRIKDNRGSKVITLFREEDRNKSRMWKARILNPILGFADDRRTLGNGR